ncbi:FkbM family methyltransferase [Flavobacterium sp.]|uniref:FkbM family methyltransferase n=1 Tax=Flavobacterium sp. TaxID=239 RepID=UPI0025D39AC2|nr:FkbM family methyltransferase [Flavobacterium sp.]
MQKIINLYRLNFFNKVLVLKYLLKRIFRLKTSEKERQINEYYFHLISFNGFLQQESTNDFIANYPDFDSIIKIRKRPSSDLNVFAQIYQYNEYKPVKEIFQKYFPNSKKINIIDAGGNIGLTSVYLSKFFPNSNFIVVEPDASNFKSVCYNFESNKIQNAIKINGGIWSKKTNLKIVNDFRDKKDWSIRVEETNEVGDLKAFSIQDLMHQHNFEVIDILKIDIEGSEKEVFTGLNTNISFLSKTKCIALEIHDEFDCRDEIYKILKEFNFDFFESGELIIGINRNLI